MPKARRKRDISDVWNFVNPLNWTQLKTWNGRNFDLAPSSGQNMGLKIENGAFSILSFSRIVSSNSFKIHSIETLNVKKESNSQNLSFCYHLVAKNVFRKFCVFWHPKVFRTTLSKLRNIKNKLKYYVYRISTEYDKNYMVYYIVNTK